MAMLRQLAKDPQAVRWWVAASFVVFAMLFGGASRPDVASIVWLRPIAVLVGAYAVYTTPAAVLRAHRGLIGVAAAIVALTAVHLMPLPPSVWHLLPGRDIIAQIDAATGTGEVWRPLSMAPTATWNALYSLTVPAAMLFLFLPMNETELGQILNVFIAMIALTAAVGLMQATGSSLSFYDIDNPNAGLFANRNHQAVVLACIFPLLAAFARQPGLRSRERRTRLAGSVVLGVAVIPLLLVTGSRAGIIAAALAIASIPFVVSIDWRRGLSRRSIALLVGGTALVAVIAWVATHTGRNVALLRFQELDATENRYPQWKVTIGLLQKYFPWGSGIGSFEQVFQIDEPAALLIPQYWNHAHNDWLELALVGGLPAMVLLALAFAGFCAATYHAFMPGKLDGLMAMHAKVGCVIISILGLASIFDYPLRTPAAGSLFVFAAVIAANRVTRTAPQVPHEEV